MPDIEIVKLKLRRGTDAQRQTVTLEQGELLFHIYIPNVGGMLL